MKRILLRDGTPVEAEANGKSLESMMIDVERDTQTGFQATNVCAELDRDCE